jgi:hypothetical protein
MSLFTFIEAIINFTIKTVIFWVSCNFYVLIQFVFNSIGIFGILFDFQFFLSDFISTIFLFLLMCSSLYMCFIFSVLIWIFIFWMIIKIFVPFVMFIPIPIIPFIIPVPLKFLMLEYIPPFKILTQRGILPMMEKIVFRFLFSQQSIKDKFSNSLSDVYGFLYSEIKTTVGDLFGSIEIETPAKPEQTPNEDYKIETVDTNTDNEAISNNELRKTENKEVMDLINEELQICLKSKQSLQTPNTSLLSGTKDMNNYSECYAKSVKAFIDNKI